MDKLLKMSTKELSRLEVLQKLSQKQMRQQEAGEILQVSTRQIKRLSESLKKQTLNLLKTKYQGIGPTLAHEKLVEKDKLKISDESVRQLMIVEGLWKSRKLKKIVTHQLRERRACFGELVQLQFVDSESFFSYSQTAEVYFKQYGNPSPSTAINTAFFE